MSMRKAIKVVEDSEIGSSCEHTFEVSQDYHNRLSWDPFLKRASLLHGVVSPKVGARALCTSRTGFSMETVYVSYDPPTIAAVEMTNGPFFFRSFAASWRFGKIAPKKTKVTFTYAFSLRCFFVFLTPWIKKVLAKNARHRLRALKRHMEEGNATGT